jgi:hypothetical protein
MHSYTKMSVSEGDLGEYIRAAKHWVEQGNLEVLKESLAELEKEVDWPTLFHRIYLHACLKQKREIAEWLETSVFPTLCPIQQIALRHIFSYGHHLLSKKN